MSQHNVYPFLIAASPYNEYGGVVCPKIIDRPFQLEKAAVRVEEGEIAVKDFVNGNKTQKLVYTCERILKPGTSVPMTDSVGRDLYMHYGFILDDSNIEGKPLAELLKKSKEHLQPHLEKHLAVEGMYKKVRNDALLIDTASSDPILNAPGNSSNSISSLSEEVKSAAANPVADVSTLNTSPVPETGSTTPAANLETVTPESMPANGIVDQPPIKESIVPEISNPKTAGDVKPTSSGNTGITPVLEDEFVKNFTKIGKISLTIGGGLIFYDGIRRLMKTPVEKQAHTEKKDSKQDELEKNARAKHKQDAFIGGVESLAAAAGLIFIWASPRIDRFFEKIISSFRVR